MTSVAIWAGVDTHGVASVYIASDSRITWGVSHHWDQGRKVFACNLKSHIFGYWGDVLFPALALPLIADRIDRGLLANTDNDWHNDVSQAIRRLWSDYPVNERRDLGLVHGFRIGDGTQCLFSLAITTYERLSDTWQTRQIPMPTESALLEVAGSGTKAVRRSHELWQSSHAANTSRAVFSAFCDYISSGVDPNTGGAPQLVGLYRIGPGRLFGIVHTDQRYFAGAALTGADALEGIEWRNHLFERVDAATKRRLRGAQQHAPRE